MSWVDINILGLGLLQWGRVFDSTGLCLGGSLPKGQPVQTLLVSSCQEGKVLAPKPAVEPITRSTRTGT